MGVFDFAEDEGAVERADAVDVAEDAEQEFLIRFHVAGIDFQQEVIVAGNVVALGDFGYALHCLHDAQGVFVGVLLHFQIAEHHETAVDFLRIEHGDVLGDESFAFQPFDTFKSRSRGEVDCRGEFFDGKARIVLKGAEDADVGDVECGVGFHVVFSEKNNILSESLMVDFYGILLL